MVARAVGETCGCRACGVGVGARVPGKSNWGRGGHARRGSGAWGRGGCGVWFARCTEGGETRVALR